MKPQEIEEKPKKQTATVDCRTLIDTLKRAEIVRDYSFITSVAQALVQFGPAPNIIVTDIDNELTLPFEAKGKDAFQITMHPPSVITALGNDKGKIRVINTPGTAGMATQKAAIDWEQNCACDFPILKEGEKVAGFVIPEKDLREALHSVSFAISNEETRYYLNGIFLTAVEGEMVMVATDGHKLATYSLGINYTGPDLIIHKTTAKHLLKLLNAKSDAPVTVSIGQPREPKDRPAKLGKLKAKTITFDTGKWTLKCKTIDGAYPDWQRVIPKDPVTTTVKITQDNASRLAGFHASSTVKIDPKAGTLDLSATPHPDFNIHLRTEGEGQAFRANALYLRQFANAMGDFTLYGTNPTEPFICRGQNPRLMGVLMPAYVGERVKRKRTATRTAQAKTT